jgi:hypothetical protein
MKGREDAMEYTETKQLEEAALEEGALEVHRLSFTEAVMLVVGATIGSGVLGLAYASRKAGWPVLLTWLLVAGFLSIASMLYVAETALRTRQPLQLSGLAEKYVGKAGSWLIFFSVGATSFCSLIAYITGCGKILSAFFGLPVQEASLLFSIGATAVVWLGLKVTGTAEKFLGLGMILMLLVLVGASFLWARVPVEEILYAHWTWGIPVFNIAVFCYAVQYIVPELARGFRDRPEKLVPAILGGTGISFLILALVPLAVFLMLPGSEITQGGFSFLGAGPGESAVLSAGELLCILCHAHFFLGHCGKLPDQLHRTAGVPVGTGFPQPGPVPGLHRPSAHLPGQQRPGGLCQRHFQRRDLWGHHHVGAAGIHAPERPEKGGPGTLLAVRLAGRSLDPASGAGGVPGVRCVCAAEHRGDAARRMVKNRGCEKMLFHTPSLVTSRWKPADASEIKAL